MSGILDKIGPVAKAVAAAVFGAVEGLLIAGFAQGFNWTAIGAAAATAAIQALAVYIVPNKPKAAQKKAA